MEKIIEVDGKEVKLKSSAAFAIRYKQQFRRDPLADIMKLGKSVTKVKPIKKEDLGKEIEELQEELDIEDVDLSEMANLDFEVLFNITWALAKNADKSIPGPLEFFDQFEEFPILDSIDIIFDLALTSMGTNVIPKKK